MADLKASNMGIATSTTAIWGVNAISDHGWYINLRLGVGSDHSTQASFDPILFGKLL